MNKLIKPFLSSRFIKFAIIGGLNTLIHLAVYNLVLQIDNKIVLANTIAFIVASVFSYFANTKFTYNNNPEKTTFVLAMLTFIVKLGVSDALTYGFHKLILSINWQVKLLTKIIPIFVTIITLPLQFIVFNVIFKNKKGETSA